MVLRILIYHVEGMVFFTKQNANLLAGVIESFFFYLDMAVLFL